MKTNKLFKTALLLLLAVAGTNTAWAAPGDPVNIPNTGYLDWNYATITGATIQTDPTELGSTGSSTDAQFNLHNATLQDYAFSFATGSQSEATLQVSITPSGESTPLLLESIAITNTGAWTPSVFHCYHISQLPIGDYVLRFKVTAASGYAGNYGRVSFTPAALGTVDITTGVYANGVKMNDEKTEVGWIKNGGTASYLLYNLNDATYKVLANISDNASGNGKINVSMAHYGSSNEYNDTYNITGTNANSEIISFASLSRGFKLLNLSFEVEGGGYVCNYNNIRFQMLSMNLDESKDYNPNYPENIPGVDVVLTRNLSANNWSTIMLPFNISATDLGTALGTTVTLAQFDNYNSENKQLEFTTASSITANTPYMIKVSNDVSGAKTINGVNIVTTGNKYVDQNGVRFQGVYASTKMDAGDYFVSGGNLYKASGSTLNIKPFRAYFKDVPAGARLMFFDETTGISEVMGNTEKASGNYYDLQGRRIAQPQKGLYIVNGKKVFVK